MNQFDELFESPPEVWLTALASYQLSLAETLLDTTGSPEIAAEKWLSAAPADTFGFGAVRSSRPFFEKLTDELEAFLCGDPKYEKERQNLTAETKPTHALVISAVSAAIAPAVGASAPVLVPAIVFLLMTGGKLTLNAWCTLRKEQRQKRLAANESSLQSLGDSSK